MVAQYAPDVTQWLREDPDLSGVENPAARRRPTATPNNPRGSGSSSSWPAIAGISSSIWSERLSGTKPLELSWIDVSGSGEGIPVPLTSNGATAIDVRPVRSTGY